jgi:hypothetical protein
MRKRAGRHLLVEYIDARFPSRREFATLLGCSPAYLSMLISGAKAPSLAMARRIEIATSGAVPMASFVDEDDVVLTDPEPIAPALADAEPPPTSPSEPVGA